MPKIDDFLNNLALLARMLQREIDHCQTLANQ
jgi:hypothetical protein